MVVGIDNISPGESTGKAALGGMRNYLQDLLTLLPECRPHWRFKLMTPEWADPFDSPLAANLELVPCRLLRGRMARVAFEQFGLPALIRHHSVDVWLATCNTLPVRVGCRSALVVQSLQYFTHPGTYNWRQRMYLRPAAARSIRAADRVIALSLASKAEIVRRFEVSEAKVDVVHHGLLGPLQGEDGGDVCTGQRLLGDDGPFVLMVSALYPYKNHARLIEAFARVRGAFPVHRLVIAGADSPGLQAADLQAQADRLGMAGALLTPGRVTSADLAWLYRHAEVMAMPSIDETFGLTVLEAMHFGCPVITSAVGSMAEVGGDAAVLVNPLSTDEIAAALALVLRDPGRQAEMRAAGRKRAALFSKERMIERTAAVIAAAGNGDNKNSPRTPLA